MPPATPWLLRTLRWSNSRQAYLERGVVLALLAGVGLLVWYRDHLSTTAQVAAGAALLLSAAVFLRRGWIKLFGPVLFYDMIRAARRGRYFLMRFLYAAVLFFVLLSVLANAQDRSNASAIAAAAEAFFDAFLAVQLIAVSLLTPAYVAGSVTEEKERKTLEYLLATDLRNREIVLSKLLSRLANLTLFLLTGLPILSMVQFLGGVDPTLVLIGFALTLLTMLGVGGLSVLYSTLLRKSRDAIAMTYLAVIAYLALSFWSLALPLEWANQNLYPDSSWTVGDVLAVFNEGNLGYVYARLQSVIWTGVQPEELWGMIAGYAIFQGVLFAACIIWAVMRLRAVALKETQSRVKRRRGLGLVRRPRVGSDPMLWKEVHIDGRFRLGWLGWAVMAVVLLSALVPGFLLFVRGLAIGAPPFGLGIDSSVGNIWEWGGWGNIGEFQREANIWVRIAGTGLASIALLAVAVRAAGSVSGERERQTLDGLLASPLDSREIFFGKWVGSVLSVRWLWAWLLLIWGMGAFMGGLLPLAVPLLALAWLAYAAAFAQVGLFFSTASRSSMRATVWTILVLAGVCFGHWLPWMCCGFGMMIVGPGTGAEEIARFQAGLTPPVALAMLAFCHWDFHYSLGPAGDEMIRMIFHCGLGAVIWGMAAFFLWASNQNYFRVKMNRDPEWLTTANRGPTPPRPPDRLAETELAEGAAPRGAVLVDETWEAPRAPRPDGEPGN